MATRKPVPTGAAPAMMHRQRLECEDGPLLARVHARMRRSETIATAAPAKAAPSQMSVEGVSTPSAAGGIRKSSIRSSRIPDALLSQAAGAAVRETTARQPPRRTRTGVEPSNGPSLSKAGRSRLSWSRQTPPAAKEGKARVGDGGTPSRRLAYKGSTGSRGSIPNVSRPLSLPSAGLMLAHTTFPPSETPETQDTTLGKLLAFHQNATGGYVTSNLSAVTSFSGAISAPSSESFSSLPRAPQGTSFDVPPSTTSFHIPLTAASPGSLSLSRSSVVASFRVSSPKLEHGRSRLNTLATANTVGIPKKHVSRLPPSMPRAVRGASTAKAAKELAADSFRTAKTLVSRQSELKAPRSKGKIKGIEHKAGEANALRQEVQAVPAAPATRPGVEHNGSIPSDNDILDSSVRLPASAMFQRETPLVWKFRSSLRGYQNGSSIHLDTSAARDGVDSLNTPARYSSASLHSASASKTVLFSTSAVCSSAAEVSSSSSVSSDASSVSVPSQAAAPSSPRATLQASATASAKASSPLRSILRTPSLTSPSMAAEAAERTKRRRRNARFALFGFPAASPGVATSRDVRGLVSAHHLESAFPPGATVEPGDKEDEAALASFEDTRTEITDANLSLGEGFPARWWGNTRKRVEDTRTLVKQWQKDTLAQWDDEQVHEIDVLASSVESVGSRVHEVLKVELQELIRPGWVINSSDPLVQRMLLTPEEAEKGGFPRRGRKRMEDAISIWRGPSAQSIFGDRLLMVTQAPYTILGVYARRTWAASLPSAVARRIFEAAEAERQRLAVPEKPLRDKKEVLRTRFSLGAKNMLSAVSFGVPTGDSSRKQSSVCRSPSRWSLPAPRTTTREEENIAGPTGLPTAIIAVPGACAKLDEAAVTAAADGPAAASAEGRGWTLPYTTELKASMGDDRQIIREPPSACKKALATELAALLGVHPSPCPFPIDALKPYPPPGYGRAPTEEEDLRIFSDLEDFLYVNRVRIKRPPGDFRHTPLLSTLKCTQGTPSDEDATSATKTRESSFGEVVPNTEVVAVERPRAGHVLEPVWIPTEKRNLEEIASGSQKISELCRCLTCANGSSLGANTDMLPWSLCALSCRQLRINGHEQESTSDQFTPERPALGGPTPIPPRTPLYAESVCGSNNVLLEGQGRKTHLMNDFLLSAEESPNVRWLHDGEKQEDITLTQVGAEESRSSDTRPVVSRVQRSTVPAPASHPSTERKIVAEHGYKMDRRTMGARLRSQSSMDMFEITKRTMPSERKQLRHTPSPKVTVCGEKGTRICWEPKTYCEHIQREAGKKLLNQEDVKVSEFWKLHLKEDGTSLWSYEGLQCEPITVSSTSYDALLSFMLQVR